jgi:ankyrin repeat protein
MISLHAACRYGDTELVKRLLDGDGGARVDEKDEWGETALMLASMGGHTEMGRLLLDKGALANEKDKDGRTALMLASERDHTEVVKLLLDKGALLDKKNEDGRTALWWASEKGHAEVVRLLLDKGALLEEKNRNGRTALMLASMKGHAEVVRLLLDRGALFDEKDKYGDTALMSTSEKDHTELVKLLLGKGASVDEVTKDTALQALVDADEDQLGRMAAGLLYKHLLDPDGQKGNEATQEAVLHLVRLAGSAAARARTLRSSDPRSADDHLVLFGRLQLAAAACVQNDESGKARDEDDVQELFRSGDGRTALEHAVQIEAKELLAQPVVQGYIKVAWRGSDFTRRGLGLEHGGLGKVHWTLRSRMRQAVRAALLLIELLFLLPLVALVPTLERRCGATSQCTSCVCPPSSSASSAPPTWPLP